MAKAVEKVLLFNLGTVGFYIGLDSVVEVMTGISSRLDASRSDIGRSIVSALSFRETWIPCVDPTLKFDLAAVETMADRIAVVLKGEEGNWAILVDRVGEVVERGNLVPCEIPELLKLSALGSYSEVALCEGRPYVGFDLERFYGSCSVSA